MNNYTGNCSTMYDFVIIVIPEEFINGMTECLSGDVIEGGWDE